MAQEANKPGETGNPAGYSGLPSNVAAMAGTVAEHARLRFQILELEGREAVGHYLRLAILVAVGLVFLLFAYLFLLIGGVFLLAEATQWPWQWVTAGVGGAHLLLAVILVAVAKSLFKKPVLTETLSELKNDTEWLRKKSAQ